MGGQALVQVAGEQRDALRPWVMAEEVACHAHLAAAAGAEHGLIQPGPVFNRLVAGGLQAGEGDGDHGDTKAYVCTRRVIPSCHGSVPGHRLYPCCHPPLRRETRVTPGARAARVRLRRTLALG
jgi:hypothetical protein